MDVANCVMCDKELDLFDELQPYGGGEIQLIFAYGSRKFDNNLGSTIFKGVICDECAVPLVKNLS